MTGESGSVESMISGVGAFLAAAAIMLAVYALFRATGPADAGIALQSAAAEICGDIGTVAAAAVPYNRSAIYPMQGINVTIGHDYVVASDGNGREFTRPLVVRVYPGSYAGLPDACWNDTGEMRSYLERTYWAPGTKELPMSPENSSKASALLEHAGLEMGVRPLALDPGRALTVEKLYLYTYNGTDDTTEVRPYVFVLQR